MHNYYIYYLWYRQVRYSDTCLVVMSCYLYGMCMFGACI